MEAEAIRRFNESGFDILAEIVDTERCDRLACELTELHEQQQRETRNKIGGIRNLLRENELAHRLACVELQRVAEHYLNQPAFPVRALFFDKTPTANWRVPWHQDLAIAVKRRMEVAGFGGWSIKEDVPHVQPPTQVLESMLTVRLHLDSCPIDNGALGVIPGSHTHGKLTTEEITALTANHPFVCEIQKGGALVMRPLLLHASSPARSASHRRVLHVEFASQPLPGGLEWFERS